jgi:hypothetical protein
MIFDKPVTLTFDQASSVSHSEGPSLLFACTPAGVQRLAALLREVPTSEIRLETTVDIALEGLTSFVWSVDLRPFLRRRDRTPSLEWGGDAEAWESRAQLVEALRRPGESQFLDYESVGDVGITVEVVGA